MSRYGASGGPAPPEGPPGGYDAPSDPWGDGRVERRSRPRPGTTRIRPLPTGVRPHRRHHRGAISVFRSLLGLAVRSPPGPSRPPPT